MMEENQLTNRNFRNDENRTPTPTTTTNDPSTTNTTRYPDKSNQPPTPAPQYYLPNMSEIRNNVSEVVQNTIQVPKEYAQGLYRETEEVVQETTTTLCKWILRIIAAIVILCITIGMAFTMYCIMYWLVIPTKEHSYSLHFDYGHTPSMVINRQLTGNSVLSGMLLTNEGAISYGTEKMTSPLATVDLLSTRREQWNSTSLLNKSDTIGDRLLVQGLGYTVTVKLVSLNSVPIFFLNLFILYLLFMDGNNE
jgi:hypothetical protein